MAVVQQQQAQQQGFKYHFVRSNYVTWFTDWLLGLGGKSAHVILIFTMLYMSAELYPGVSLPPGLNITVFLVQMFALDMGGMGLASLARQARADGNTEGADKAQKLSRWLIRIMIASLVTVCLEQAISNIPGIGAAQGYIDAIKLLVEVALVVARAICAVLYGVTIHSLEARSAQHHLAAPATPAQLDYQEIARHLKAMFPQPAPTPQLDYQEIARHIAPVMPAPQVDYREIARHFEATLRATIVREIREVKATIPQLEARASSQETIEATFEGQEKPKARATKRNTGPLSGATQERQAEAGATDTGSTDDKLEGAYQRLIAEGGRISGRALAPLARVNKNTAARWLRATHPETTNEGQGQQDSEPGPGDEDEATIEGQE